MRAARTREGWMSGMDELAGQDRARLASAAQAAGVGSLVHSDAAPAEYPGAAVEGATREPATLNDHRAFDGPESAPPTIPAADALTDSPPDGPAGANEITVPELAQIPRARRRGKRARPVRPSRPPRRVQIVRRVVAAVLLVAVLALAAVGGVNAYQQYSHVRAEALDGVAHLKRAEAVLQPLAQHPSIPDASTLQMVAGELRAAEHDFALTRRDLGHGAFAFAASVPQGQAMLDPVEALVAAADEACQAGQDLLDSANLILPLLHGDLFPSDTPAAGTQPSSPAAPAVTAATLQQLTADFEAAVPHLNAAVADLQGANLAALPPGLVSKQQLDQIHTLLAQWPRISDELATADAWLHVAPALLGLNGATRLLVLLMDRGEMRATGGYIGDYGVLTIQGGRLQPFSLKDVYSLDYYYGGHTAPTAYPWWPFRNWGLRDSNLSPDFPTSAQMQMQLFTAEGQAPVQGVVALTAPAIERVLGVVGPISMPDYQQTVTAANLEDLIRQYTENPAELLTWGHEQFTIELGHAFMGKLHGLQGGQLVAIAQAMLASLRAKDIQVYMSDPAVAALLAQQNLDGAITHGPGDGLTIADDNVSVNKASAVTIITATDSVALGADGTATHHLTITYDFNSARNPGIRPYLFDADWYRTYLRVYVPPTARLQAQDGFNWGSVQLGPSDVPGRTMWGGYLLARDGVPYALHFAWSVPHAATADTSGQRSYTLTVQHQAGSNQQLDLRITGPGATAPSASYQGVLDQDRAFAVADLGGDAPRFSWWPW
jgi:hypothetical protein